MLERFGEQQILVSQLETDQVIARLERLLERARDEGPPPGQR